MALIVYNKENSRPQQVVYQRKRTINMDSKGTVYLSKTMSIELGILVEDGLISHTMRIRENGISAIRQTRTGSLYGKIKGVPDSLPDSSCEESCFRQKWKGRPYSL